MIQRIRVVLAVVLLSCAAFVVALTFEGFSTTGQLIDAGRDTSAMNDDDYVFVRGLRVPKWCIPILPNGSRVEADRSITDILTGRKIGELPPPCSFLYQLNSKQEQKLGVYGSGPTLDGAAPAGPQWGIQWNLGKTGLEVLCQYDASCPGPNPNAFPGFVADEAGHVNDAGAYWYLTQFQEHFITPNVPQAPTGAIDGGFRYRETFWPGFSTFNSYSYLSNPAAGTVMQPVFTSNSGSNTWQINYTYCCDSVYTSSFPLVNGIEAGTPVYFGLSIDNRRPCQIPDLDGSVDQYRGMGCSYIASAEYGYIDASAVGRNFGSFYVPPWQGPVVDVTPITFELPATRPCGNGNIVECASYPHEWDGAVIDSAVDDGSTGTFTVVVDGMYEYFWPNDGAPGVNIPVYPPYPPPMWGLNDAGLALFYGNIPDSAYGQQLIYNNVGNAYGFGNEWQANYGWVENIVLNTAYTNNGTANIAPNFLDSSLACGCFGSFSIDGGAITASFHP
jgi:hypothetical protein